VVLVDDWLDIETDMEAEAEAEAEGKALEFNEDGGDEITLVTGG
jgi:hypothetical protein